MKNDIVVQEGIVIPEHELEITTSRSSGPGGQHVQKSSTRISVRWNVKNTTVLNEAQKERALQKLQARLTSKGDLLVHNGTSRSQHTNKELALAELGRLVRKALHVPKKRIATQVSEGAKETRLQEKKQRSITKKMRRVKDYN